MPKAIETKVFANTDEKNRILTVVKISHEIDFHCEAVPYAKYDNCIEAGFLGTTVTTRAPSEHESGAYCTLGASTKAACFHTLATVRH